VRPGASFAVDNFVIYRGVDRQPPAKVAGLAAQSTRSGVRLSWDPAEDNVAAQLYVVSRADGGGGFRKIGESHTPDYHDPTVEKGRYRYRVCAVDFEENMGAWSDAATVDAVAGGPSPPASREAQDRIGYADYVRRIHARGVGKVRKGHATLFGDSLTGATVYPQCAQAAFGNLTVNAFGYPSMRTSFGRNKVGEILAKDNPEFMFILYGTNNNKREDQLPAAMDDLAAITKACEQHGTVPVLGTIPPRGWTAESAPEANFNRHVAELCRQHKIPTGYIFEDFLAAGDRRKYMGGDGVHWRGEGMEIAARAWGKTLDQIRFVLRDRK
jgi:lysophospholipase L1-like esterase